MFVHIINEVFNFYNLVKWSSISHWYIFLGYNWFSFRRLATGKAFMKMKQHVSSFGKMEIQKNVIGRVEIWNRGKILLQLFGTCIYFRDLYWYFDLFGAFNFCFHHCISIISFLSIITPIWTYNNSSICQMFSFQIAFSFMIYPCLLLTYIGQAAYLMANPHGVNNVFYNSIPGKFHSNNFILESISLLLNLYGGISIFNISLLGYMCFDLQNEGGNPYCINHYNNSKCEISV